MDYDFDVLEVNAPDSGVSTDKTDELLEAAGLPEENVLISYKPGASVFPNHNITGSAYHLLQSNDPLKVDFYIRNRETDIDHILIAQPKGEQENVPTVTYLAPGDIIYLRKGTEVSNVDDDGFSITRKGITHDIEWGFEDGGPENIQFEFIKKKFFKEENIEKFVKKFADEDGNAQEGSGETGLVILNVKKKDIWEEIQENNQPGKCEGKQIVFKGTPRDDVLIGNCCNNVLIGGKGNDTLDGGAGDDFLIGGKGADTFVYSEGYDVIVNFDEEEDRLDLGDLQYGIDYMIEEFTNPLGGTGVKFVFA